MAANLIASYTVCFVTHFVGGGIIGSFSNDEGNGNENVKTVIGYKFGRASGFLYIFLPLLHDHDVKMANFTFYEGCTQATTKFSFSF